MNNVPDERLQQLLDLADGGDEAAKGDLFREYKIEYDAGFSGRD